MVKTKLKQDLEETVVSLGYSDIKINLTASQNPSYGDYSTNIALQLSKLNSENIKHSPQEIASKISEKMENLEYLEKVEIAGAGFINFFLKPASISTQIEEILDSGRNYGKNTLGQDQKIQVEFISANPTGPLTLANGRGGALGDVLSNVLKFSGYEVEKEYYLNDTGNQVRILGDSVKAKLGLIEESENFYKGDYIEDLAKVTQKNNWNDLDSQELGHKLADHLIDTQIKASIKAMEIDYDRYYSERSLSQKGLIDKTLKVLDERGVVYQKDGAYWFKATEYGDEKDRVLFTSKEGTRGKAEPTYLLSDLAHHLDIYGEGFDKRINILGADHHGNAQTIKRALEAIGYSDRLDIILIQFVRLIKDGQEFKMSKRAGTYVALEELLSLVSKDVARFFFLMYAPTSHINFDIDLAQKKSSENPVFYVQYAHARICNILNKNEAEIKPENLDKLTSKDELNLIKHLLEFPDLVEEISRSYQVQGLTTYSITLADLFHKFYESCPVLNLEDKDLSIARLSLVEATRVTLKNTLDLLGVEAPERM